MSISMSKVKALKACSGLNWNLAVGEEGMIPQELAKSLETSNPAIVEIVKPKVKPEKVEKDQDK